MKGSAWNNRRAREATKDRLAGELRELAAACGARIVLDWCGWSTPWRAQVAEHPERTVSRNTLRYWVEQGWARRTDPMDSRFTLEIELEMLPAETGPQVTARAGDVARRA
jgi:hypothetical protein